MGAFQPNRQFEVDKLMVVEQALGEDGIIDAHLRWADTDNAPSSEISDRDYGYVPASFTGDTTGKRPGHEPLDFTRLATDALQLPYDTPHHELSKRIYEVDSGWSEFLLKEGALSPEQIAGMGNAAMQAYMLDTLTEDNLPAYTSTILGGFQALAAKYGKEIPALEEWGRGIWTAEEGAHGFAMNEYGLMTNILNTPEHVAGRTSQLRAGMEVELAHVIQLFAYVSWQELSTNYAHKRNGTLLGPIGSRLLTRVAKDEARHHVVYQKALGRLFEAFPGDTIMTLHSELMQPTMPGLKGIPNFKRRALKIHGSGIFSTEQAEDAAKAVLKKLKLYDERDDLKLSDEEQLALQELKERYPLEPTDEPRRSSAKFVLGKTITASETSQLRRDYEKSVGIAERQEALQR